MKTPPDKTANEINPYQSLRLMVDHSGVGLFHTSTSGEYHFLNLTLAQLLGYDSVAELLADRRTASSFYYDEKDRDRFSRKVASVGTVTGFVSQAKRRDGSTFWISEHATTVRDDNDEIVGYVGSITDVTDIIETQEKLVQAEAEYRRIFERATEGIYRSSIDGRMLNANPALTRLNGYETTEELLTSVHDIAREWYVDPGRRQEFMTLLEENGVVEDFESEILRHNTQERIWVNENAYLVRDKDGNPMFYEGTVRDVSKRKQAEADILQAKQDAEAANRSKTQFLANMSHELRTPLNSIIGFTELLQIEHRGPIGAPIYRDYLADVHKSAIMLLDLINDILDSAKLDAGKLEIERDPVSLDAQVRAVVKTLEPEALAGKVTLELAEMPNDLPDILGDERRVQQILQNLLSNAVKYTEPGGKVTLSICRRPKHILVQIKDTGVGIPPLDLPKVFIPFEQSGYAVSLAKRGTGLGLPLARDLARQHGGDVTLDSTVGVGTTATVRFPIPEPESDRD